MIYTFSTSTIGAGSTISDATLSLFGTAKTNALGSPDLHLAGATPAADNTLASSDYPNVQATSFGNVTYANWSTTAYNDVTLDANGIANVNKTGISRFSARTDWDINNSFTGVWASAALSNLTHNTADAAGTANDPKLVVTYVGFTNYITKPIKLRPYSFKPQLAR